MKTRLTVALVVLFSCISLQAGAQALGMLRNTIFPIENFILNEGYFLTVYDFHVAPQKTPGELMAIKGNPKAFVQLTDVKDYHNEFSVGQYTDTILFDNASRLEYLRSMRKSSDGQYLFPFRVGIVYNDNGTISELDGISVAESIDGYAYRLDVSNYEYENGKLAKELYTMLENKNGEWVPVSSFNKKEEAVYQYNALGQLEKGDFIGNQVVYNAEGLISYIEEDGMKPYQYTYDAEGRVQKMVSQTIDGMEEDYYIKKTNIITRNQQGDIVKAVATEDECNSKWIVTRKGTPQTTTIAYSYDEKGNWTTAKVSQGNNVLLTITREYIY